MFALFDWMGSHSAKRLFNLLRAAGAEVRVFNPPTLRRSAGMDHAQPPQDDHRRRPHRFRQRAVHQRQVERQPGQADAAVARHGHRDRRTGGGRHRARVRRRLAHLRRRRRSVAGDRSRWRRPPGGIAARIVEGVPNHTGTYRLDLVIASLARRYLWLTDAYFVGTSAYVQALARGGDATASTCACWCPGASDIPALRPLSRAGYRGLIEAGVRVFEWNGTMLHAKTAVADDFWSRIGSTNLNLASWMGNYELDVVDRGRRLRRRGWPRSTRKT